MCHVPETNGRSEVVLIAGSPTYPSRSTAALERVRDFLKEDQVSSHLLNVRYLPAEALLFGDPDHSEIQAALHRIAEARVVVLATPVYKSAYAGTLKAFLDLLPQDALKDKAVLPVATGDSAGHLLVLDYALKPVLAALGAQHILGGVFLTDAQVARAATGGYRFEEGGEKRLRAAVREVTRLARGETEERPARANTPQPKSDFLVAAH